MNGTVIDIEGISVDVNHISLEDSTDKAYMITIKDEHGRQIKIDIAFGEIINISW